MAAIAFICVSPFRKGRLRGISNPSGSPLPHGVELLPELGGLHVAAGGGQHAVDVDEPPLAPDIVRRQDAAGMPDGPARLHRLDDEIAEGDDGAEAEQQKDAEKKIGYGIYHVLPPE